MVSILSFCAELGIVRIERARCWWELGGSVMHTFVPINHVILLLRLLLPLPRVLIQILLLPLPLHAQIVAEFTLPPLLAIPLLIKYTKNGLRVHPKRYLLDLHRFEKLCCFPLCLLVGFLFLFPLRFFGGFLFLFGGLGLGGLGLD